jgi:hypothetical protein
MARNLMNDLTEGKLQTAYALIKAGQPDQAIKILRPLLRANPEVEEAWFLLGHAVDSPQEKIRCFRQAVRLDPSDQAARRQLDRLLAAQPAASSKSPRLIWGLAGLAGLLICLVGLGLAWNFSRVGMASPAPVVVSDQPASQPVVSLAVASQPPVSPIPQRTSRPTITLLPTWTPLPSVTAIPTLTLTFTPTSTRAPRTGKQVPTVCVAPNGLGNFTAPFKIENFGKDKSTIYLKGISPNGNHPISCQIQVKQGVPIIIELVFGDYEYIVLRAGTIRRGTFFINKPTKATMQIFADKIRLGEFP